MKKFFGVLLLLIGLFGAVTGMATIASSQASSDCIESQVSAEFANSYRESIEQGKIIGGVFVGIGLVFFVIGIVLVATKTKKQRLMEAELLLLKTNHGVVINSNVDLVGAIEQLGKLKDKGLLSEEEFIEQKRKILN